jgi:RNA polymerase sigma-70 factor (ECF subfamily)
VVVGRPLTEHELVERAREGDGHAYASLVREHEEIAFRIAYVICGSAADAEEAAQEAFVKAYNALGRFRLGEPLRPWLLAIVANEARNRRRAAGRRAALALSAAPRCWPGSSGCPSATAL